MVEIGTTCWTEDESTDEMYMALVALHKTTARSNHRWSSVNKGVVQDRGAMVPLWKRQRAAQIREADEETNESNAARR